MGDSNNKSVKPNKFHLQSAKLTKAQKGTIGEYQAIVDLTKQGYHVALACNPQCPFDLVAVNDDDSVKINPNNITIISINESGKVLFSGRVVREKSLDQNNLYQIKSLAENELMKNDKMIFSVQVTPKTKYADYIKVLDYLKAAKATKISIAN